MAIGVGVVLTIVMTTLSFAASSAGRESLSEILLWPNTLLQNLVPIVYGRPNIGTPEHPLYEGTPVNIAALFLSFPIAILVYSAVAYLVMRQIRRSARYR
jgi:hypothetical protein